MYVSGRLGLDLGTIKAAVVVFDPVSDFELVSVVEVTNHLQNINVRFRPFHLSVEGTLLGFRGHIGLFFLERSMFKPGRPEPRLLRGSFVIGISHELLEPLPLIGALKSNSNALLIAAAECSALALLKRA